MQKLLTEANARINVGAKYRKAHIALQKRAHKLVNKRGFFGTIVAFLTGRN
jgi:hypothetical protein